MKTNKIINDLKIFRDFKKEKNPGFFGMANDCLIISNEEHTCKIGLVGKIDKLEKEFFEIIKYDTNKFENISKNWNEYDISIYLLHIEELFENNYYRELALYFEAKNTVFLEFITVMAYYKMISGNETVDLIMKEYCNWLCHKGLLEKKNNM